MDDIVERIRQMNQTFEIPCNDQLTDLGAKRLRQFENILKEECDELTSIVNYAEHAKHSPHEIIKQIELNERFVNLADFLGDIIVYTVSESHRWGIPILPVLHAILDSQESKLVDGKPLKDERQKFIEGPNYRPPEDAIEKILTDL